MGLILQLQRNIYGTQLCQVVLIVSPCFIMPNPWPRPQMSMPLWPAASPRRDLINFGAEKSGIVWDP